MALKDNNPTELGEAIRRALQSRVEEITEEEIAKAKKRIEERLRENVAQFCIQMFNRVDMEYRGQELRIIVDHNLDNSNEKQG